jgi:copper chaperone CopZ
MKKIITIQGTHCKSCKFLIEDIASDIPGVISINVDHETGKTEIEYDETLDWNKLKSAIEGQGDYKFIA